MKWWLMLQLFLENLQNVLKCFCSLLLVCVWLVAFVMCHMCNMLVMWPTGAEGACAEGKVPRAILYVHRLRGDPSPVPGAQPRQTLHPWGEERQTAQTLKFKLANMKFEHSRSSSVFLFLQQVMKDKWINTGYEGDELKPHIEPVEDYSDPARIGASAAILPQRIY